MANRLQLLLLLTFCLLSCGKESAVNAPATAETHANMIEGDRLCIVYAPSGQVDTMLKPLLPLKNIGNAPVSIERVQVSCSCLDYKGPRHIVLAPGQSTSIELDMHLEAAMGTRVAHAILQFADKSAIDITVRAQRGEEFELAPATVQLSGVADRNQEFETEARFFGSPTTASSLSTEPGDSLRLIGYKSEVVKTKQTAGFIYYRIRHILPQGLPPGISSFQVAVWPTGKDREMAQTLEIRTTGFSEKYIPPAVAIASKGQATSVSLNVPWLNTKAQRKILVAGLEIGCGELAPNGHLSFPLPAEVLDDSMPIRNLTGVIQVEAKGEVPFSVVVTTVGG